MNKKLKLLVAFFLFISLLAGTAEIAFGVNTGIGPIPDDPAQAASILIKIAVGVAGGVAFLLMVSGAIRIISSQGDPKALQEARGVFTAAITGLLVIILSVFILRIIGIDILGLPITFSPRPAYAVVPGPCPLPPCPPPAGGGFSDVEDCVSEIFSGI